MACQLCGESDCYGNRCLRRTAGVLADGPPATVDELAVRLHSLPVAVDPDDDSDAPADDDATDLSEPDADYWPAMPGEEFRPTQPPPDRLPAMPDADAAETAP